MIHILCADLSGADELIYRNLYEKATPERQRRAARYRRREDRLRCVVCDALLRTALGTDHYEIETNEFGKPYVKDRPGFCYNLSHSGRYAVIAWGSTPVGVDVQQHTAVDMDAIAKRWFAPDERAYIRESTGTACQRFYEIWTGKESYIKYLGEGLHRDFRSFSVLAPEPEIQYLHRSPGEGYSLCLCSAESDCTFGLVNAAQL